jgi:xanthine dehydrogenase YagR molybdenum-binding subunit
MSAIGMPLSRVDGRLKVTGGARYTADVAMKAAAHAAIVHSTVAAGRTVSIDTATAEKAPGVIAVLTHRNLDRMNPVPKPWSHLHPAGQGYLPLQDDLVNYAGQPIALVIAESVVQAEYAGTLIEIAYQAGGHAIFDDEATKIAVTPPPLYFPVSSSAGDPGKSLEAASVKIERTFSTPDRHHNQMEPHATLAFWEADGSLTLFETTQHVSGTKEFVAIVLGVPADKVRVVSQFLGGGFGGKAYVWPHTLLAALAARSVRRPVRVQLTRAQMYSMAGHQPATIQKVALGADGNGQLTGIRHDSISVSSMFDNYIEYPGMSTRSLWRAGGNVATDHKIVHVNRNTPCPMRAPHEAVGLFATESAMDELAYATNVDPVALRILNDSDTDPTSGQKFSTRGLQKCLVEGAKRFRWDARTPEPRSMRDGRYLIGQGVACAIYENARGPTKARVILHKNGTAWVEAGTHDIGTGTYTVLAQVAADSLGMKQGRVAVRLGDTNLPKSQGSFGSMTVSNAGASVMLAARAVRDKAISLALNGRDAPFAGAALEDVVIADGRMSLGKSTRSIAFGELLARNGLETISADGDYAPEAESKKTLASFSAVYAEVRVDEELGLVRLSRFVGVYDAGTIVNPKTARSQAIGGIIWGVGHALLEHSETDPVLGRFLNRNFSAYLVPTNADIPHLDVSFVEEFDGETSPLGTKGLGEITAAGVAPAIANAIFHATGKRISDLPIKIEDIL